MVRSSRWRMCFAAGAAALCALPLIPAMAQQQTVLRRWVDDRKAVIASAPAAQRAGDRSKTGDADGTDRELQARSHPAPGALKPQ